MKNNILSVNEYNLLLFISLNLSKDTDNLTFKGTNIFKRSIRTIKNALSISTDETIQRMIFTLTNLGVLTDKTMVAGKMNSFAVNTQILNKLIKKPYDLNATIKHCDKPMGNNWQCRVCGKELMSQTMSQALYRKHLYLALHKSGYPAKWNLDNMTHAQIEAKHDLIDQINKRITYNMLSGDIIDIYLEKLASND